MLIAAGAGLFLLWRRYGRKHSARFNGDYYRELPADYSPAELSVLWNDKRMKAQDITATILDLARRKFFYLEQAELEERKLLGSKTTTTYLLRFLPGPKPSELRKAEEAVLRPHEQQLIEFLKNNIAKGQESVYLTDIEQYAKKNGQDFYSFWHEWTSGLLSKSAEYKFFDESGRMSGLCVWLGLALFIGGSAIVAKLGASAPGFALVIAGALYLFIPKQFKRRSASGQEDYVRWQAFKRFLQHFSEMERHEIPSLIIWEHYLVFAVTLGVAKEVIKQLELVFPNLQDGDYRFAGSWMTYDAYNNINNLQQSFDGIGFSLDRALQTVEKAAGKKSSGSGSGGGFSDGGGGGEGGSSYGGR